MTSTLTAMPDHEFFRTNPTRSYRVRPAEVREIEDDRRFSNITHLTVVRRDHAAIVILVEDDQVEAITGFTDRKAARSFDVRLDEAMAAAAPPSRRSRRVAR